MPRARSSPRSPIPRAARWCAACAEGPLTATELAGPTGISRQAVAKHLRALAMAGLAIGTHEGRETRFELRTAAFVEAEAWMRAVGASWTLRLDALRTLVERPDLRVAPER